MDSIHHSTTIQLPQDPTPRPPRLARIRAWLRSRKGRVIFPIATFAIGMATALLIVLLVLLSLSKDIAAIRAPSSPQGDIVIQVGPTYITRLVAQDLLTTGLPGTVKNVRVTFARGDQMNIDGDDQFSVVGISFTRHFTINLQPYVHDCQLQVHVLHADLSGIPVTSFVASFESQINQQLLAKPTNLPQGFTYCNTGVHTDPSGLFIIYSATPV
jgi:hypothetical protein